MHMSTIDECKAIIQQIKNKYIHLLKSHQTQTIKITLEEMNQILRRGNPSIRRKLF